jgi:rhamnose utilization protein RhaD (predicted bifunctional aldolase and dehydrogenase)/NAD(P)-dependent dehydrogenase (short-subunit alcohol dehydrogenase family)
MANELKQLVELSRQYGNDEEFVLAGGGNTSYKTTDTLYVKASGTTLGNISENGFVKLNRKDLDAVFTKKYPKSDAAREAQVTTDIMNARQTGELEKRPSVEAIMHNLLPQKFVFHTHPALVNGLTCGKKGEEYCKKLFGKNALWIGIVNPGYKMAELIKNKADEYLAQNKKSPEIIFLQNHGLVVAADTTSKIKTLSNKVMNTLKKAAKAKPDFKEVKFDKEKIVAIAPAVRMLCMNESSQGIATFAADKEIMKIVKSAAEFKKICGAFSPDHIVYYGHLPLFVPLRKTMDAQYKELQKQISGFIKKNGYSPKIIGIEKTGVFAFAPSIKEADTALCLFRDALKILAYSKSFGGASFMSKKYVDFIRNWEAESYRKKIAAGNGANRLQEKISIVTGSAQGFGKGIAEEMLAEGANVAIADLNFDLAKENADNLSATFGNGKAFAISVNVGNEKSVKEMIDKTVIKYGGLDIFVSNAGVLRAGGLEKIDMSTFEFMTRINYSAYYLCAKYASRIMKIQNRFAPIYTTDIIQVNSKSGLEGSKNNFTYAGGKFGGLGLTQSFALELTEFNIKVNSICPGNFFDGPLWADPKKGLFIQYLNSNKVPGAKTVEDVKKFYEAKVPMNRGCGTKDVARALLYIVEQQYETGQAVPVTGGQNMLK